MHRDIKPENLIVHENEGYQVFLFIKLFLVDFGLAENASNQQRIFTRCGTPGYVAPEVLNDLPYDTKADVFSGGIILYNL